MNGSLGNSAAFLSSFALLLGQPPAASCVDVCPDADHTFGIAMVMEINAQ
jgi:hypothetical protein